MIHPPVGPFFSNWLSWRAAALAHNVGLWLRTLALPRASRRARGKRLRLAFLNIAARLLRHGRRLQLRFAAAHPAPARLHRRPEPDPRASRVRLTRDRLAGIRHHDRHEDPRRSGMPAHGRHRPAQLDPADPPASDGARRPTSLPERYHHQNDQEIRAPG
jgi:hypothetical protein